MADLKSFRTENNLTQQDIAEYLGTSRAFVSQVEAGKCKLPERLLGMLRSNGKFWTTESLSEEVKEEQKTEQSVRMIPLIPTVAVGGSLNGFSEGYCMHDCEQVPAPMANVDIAMNVYGESMSPEYPNGSRVYARKVDPNTYIEWGQVYILATSSGSIIKEVWKSGKEGCVECHSINPEPKYAPFDVELESIYGMYRVVGLLTTK